MAITIRTFPYYSHTTPMLETPRWEDCGQVPENEVPRCKGYVRGLGPIDTAWWYTYHLEKYEFVNGKDDIPYIMENEKCLKPPTRINVIMG